jgi:DNA polymerase delta subunit 1
MYRTNNINDTELVYSLLREKYPDNQVHISYDNIDKEYTLTLTQNPYKKDPEVQVDFFTRVIYGDTDSIFVEIKFNRKDFRKNREDTFKLASICGDNVTDKIFNRQPICLEFEKVFQPFILLTKKRYIGKKFENMKDPFKLKEITKSGIAVTRRDFSKMVKDCYTEVIDCIVDEGNDSGIQRSVEIYKKYVDRIDAYQIDIDDLITSKTLAKSYSCSLCKKKTEWIHIKCDYCNKESPLNSTKCINTKCGKSFKCIHKFNLVHVQLAIKMLKRKDEANINDRIPFVFIESDDKTLAKNDLGEDPVYVKKHNLKYNRSFYLESLSKTILSFFKVCLNEHQDLLNDAIEYTNDKFESYGNKKLKPSDFKLEE